MKLLHPLSLGQARFLHAHRRTSGSEFRDIIHLHEGIEFLYIEQGNGQVFTGSRSLRAAEGTLVFFQPMQLHKLAIQATDDQPFVRSFFVYDPHWIQAYLELFPGLADFHRKLWKRNWDVQAITGLNDNDAIVQKVRGLGRLSGAESAGGGAGAAAPASTPAAASTSAASEACAIFVLSFLEQLRIDWNERRYEPLIETRREAHTELAMAWIEEHYRLPFRLQSLAEHLHLSPAYLSGLFRREVGESLSDYLAARRIKEACHLLLAGDLSLDQIAGQIGISNVSYFCQLFRRHTGETPHRFRARMKP